MCDNKEVEYTLGTPKDVSKLRERLIEMLSNRMVGSQSSQWKGPFQASMNPMQKAAMNTVYNKMGYGPRKAGPEPVENTPLPATPAANTPVVSGPSMFASGMASPVANPVAAPQAFASSPNAQMLRAMLAQRYMG